MRRATRFLGAIAIAAAIAGCAIRKPPTVSDYYAQGELMFADKQYNTAIENYQHLIDQYPFSPYAEDAELKIGLAQYLMHNHAEAITALTDFERMHPTNKKLHLVSYYLAMSYFDQIGRADQDQSNTENALEQFEILERRYPESPFAQLAHERIAICREMLARNDYVVGDYYYQRANFRAAESRLAELMQRYPDTPIAPQALYELGSTLEREGKRYSAAQAFAAVKQLFPDTTYGPKADKELKKLKQPVDNEEDPLRIVLAEAGFGAPSDAATAEHVVVHHRDNYSEVASGSSAEYGPDGLPILDPAKPSAVTGTKARAKLGPATLRSIRLSSSDPPLSVIFDLSGPVKFDKNIENETTSSTLTVRLEKAQPDSKLERHIIFDRSIFHDCEVSEDAQSTTVKVNTVPVAHFAIIPLEDPPRLLVTFTPRDREPGEAAGTGGL